MAILMQRLDGQRVVLLFVVVHAEKVVMEGE